MTTSDLLIDSYLGLSRDDLEARIRALIADAVEGAKLDFKRMLKLETAAEKAEFCKDISAIANSDGNQFGGYGYLVIGATDGKLVGGVDAWKDGGPDKFSARLTQIAKEYLAPTPALHFVAYTDDELGDWGVVVLPPSSEQPHLFIRELAGNPAKHEWFVRVNDTTERAGVGDYARVLSSTMKRAIGPLELEIQALKRVLETRSDATEPLILEALRNLKSSGAAPAPPPTGQSTAERIKHTLATPIASVEDALLDEALRLKQVMVEERPENPQRFSTAEANELLKPLVYMEEQTRPFVEALVSVLRYDEKGQLSDAVVRVFEILAEHPNLSGTHWEYASELRLYPLVLSLHALAFASVGRDDGRVLRRVLDLQLRGPNSRTEEHVIWALRSLRATKDFFNQAMGKQRFHEPIAERISKLIPPWCSGIIPGRRGQDVFFAAEFALALEHTKLGTLRGSGIPFSGSFAYSYDATQVLERLLRKRPKVLKDMFGDDVEQRLDQFDKNVGQVIEGGFRRGFAGGALAAWKGEQV